MHIWSRKIDVIYLGAEVLILKTAWKSWKKKLKWVLIGFSLHILWLLNCTLSDIYSTGDFYTSSARLPLNTHLLDMTFFCNSCRSNDASAHRAPYVATLLADNNCANTIISNRFISSTEILAYIPQRNHSDQSWLVESIWLHFYTSSSPVLPDRQHIVVL